MHCDRLAFVFPNRRGSICDKSYMDEHHKYLERMCQLETNKRVRFQIEIHDFDRELYVYFFVGVICLGGAALKQWTLQSAGSVFLLLFMFSSVTCYFQRYRDRQKWIKKHRGEYPEDKDSLYPEKIPEHYRRDTWFVVTIAALCFTGCDGSRKLTTIPDDLPRTLYSLPDHDHLIGSESVNLSFGTTSITQSVFYSTGTETSIFNVTSVILPAAKYAYPVHLIHRPGEYLEIDLDEATGLFIARDVHVREGRDGRDEHISFDKRYYSTFAQTRGSDGTTR